MSENATTADKTAPAAALGHAAHSEAAADGHGLPGEFTRPIHVTFLGAGSNFTSTLVRDLLLTPGHRGGSLRLVDVDAQRLDTMRRVVERLVRDTDQADAWTVQATADRLQALPGTDYAVCCVEVAGVQCTALDNDIPLKYGVDQCIGDTIGPGGLFKAMRTVPTFLDILRDMRRLCPGALLLNYTNPMSMMVLAAGRAVPEVPVVGLCHSVQGTSKLLAGYAGVEPADVRFECAGINHLAWMTRFEANGKDLYTSVLMEKFRQELATGRQEAEQGLGLHDSQDGRYGEETDQPYSVDDLIRKDMCIHFGAFITESSGHLSEYLPYYRKSDAGRALLRRQYNGGSRFYATNWPGWRKQADALREQWVTGEAQIEMKRSWEYGSQIIEAIEKDQPTRIHGNVMNHGGVPGRAAAGEASKLISNLPGDGAVEVACLVDGNGVQPTRYGALPPQMAHLCRSNMSVFDLGADACIHRSKAMAVHALMLDPLTSAVLAPDQISRMTHEMFDAQAEFLPGFE